MCDSGAARVVQHSERVNRLYYQPVPPAADGARVPTTLDWKPWNEALAMIALVADYDIVEAAQAIDAQIWPVHQQIKRGWSPDGGWFSLRDAIETRRQDFVNIARERLAGLVRLFGASVADQLRMIRSGSSAVHTSCPAVEARECRGWAGRPPQDARAAPPQAPGPGRQ